MLEGRFATAVLGARGRASLGERDDEAAEEEDAAGGVEESLM